MPELAREEVDVTSTLRNILDNYPPGSATLREILQNTDDAGAKQQIFILDTRTFDSDFLVDRELRVCQGPAIIAANDAAFKPKDWNAILTILSSSKTQDETSTGKYGLGFRSCYHVTDNPHILSGDKLLILDPHARAKKYPGGVKLDTKNVANEDGEIERQVYNGHFVAFSAVFKPEDEVYKGKTAIRLPLRLPGFQSKLKSTSMDVSDAREMLSDFIETELPEAMLFLKNITEIKLLEIDANGKETPLAIATKKADAVASSQTGERTKQEDISHQLISITLKIGSGLPLKSSWIITNFVETEETASGDLARRLKRPHDRKDVLAAMTKDKLLPHVALALPVPHEGATSIPEFRGRLFTLLRLPIITGFPVHINGVLALVPSRQNLRNVTDVGPGSREELLVEWNRLLFTEWVPKAWASLLGHLASRPSAAPSRPTLDFFQAWPSLVSSEDGDQGYWYPLPLRLLEEAADRVVWPLLGKSSQYSTLNDALVVVRGKEDTPLQALETCKIPLVIVSKRVFKLIEASDFKKAILSPQTVHPYLETNSNIISNLDHATRKSIRDYLACAKDIRLLENLPLIPQVQGKYTSISSDTRHVMATKSEAAIFASVHHKLLAEESMSEAVLEVLLNDPDGRVRSVGPADVAQYLKSQTNFGRTSLATIATGVKAKTFQWLVEFWKWLDKWEKFDELVNDAAAWDTIQSLHALPLRLAEGDFALRLVGKCAIRPGSMGAQTVAALATLGVPVLDVSMSSGPAVRSVSRDHGDITFILQSLSKNKSYSHLKQATRQTLFEFFTQQLYNYLQPDSRRSIRVTLNRELRDVLRNLPIFPIFSPGSRDDNKITFDVAPHGACFVDDSVKIIPKIRGTPFVSYDQGKTLHLALEEPDILEEIGVLRKAIRPDAWSQQDRLLPALIDRLMNRLNEVGDVTRARIAELAIVDVTVGPSARRKSPNQVIDPASALAELYDAEDEVLPVGVFGSESPGGYIHQLRGCRMLRAALTHNAIEDRIARISDQSSSVEHRSEKALRLLNLLDSYTRSGENVLPPDVVNNVRGSAWLPVGDQYHTPSECWDSRGKDLLLCDLVLPRVPVTVGSSHLRDYLGWIEVPFETLQSQLLTALKPESWSSDIPEMNVLERIEAVLMEVATRLQAGCLSEEHINSLVETLGDAAWVPTISRTLCVARKGMLEQIDLGMMYHSVALQLLNFPGMEALLKQMGVCDRPSQDSLFSTLREISYELSESGNETSIQEGLVRASISILNELCLNNEVTDSEFQKILIPTDGCQLLPGPEVLFNDMGGDPVDPPPGFQFAHPLVTILLSNALGLRRMSEEDFAQGGDDIQSFHLEEDLTIRIRRVLQDYDIDHSSNEWIANADDAGANSITFLVDEASFHSRGVIRRLASFQSGPALVMHNDKVFTEKDFEGMGYIGQGGKAENVESIGRFGLGALSFYHFTELPWVISGKWCLFLDPSKKYLPRERGNIERSAARIPLSLCKTRYPGQLKPLEGLFGFSSELDDYKGTLFRFPLRTAKSKLSDTFFGPVEITNQINRFYAYASQSLFFTKSLKEVTACRRTKDDLKITPVWHAKATCKPISYGVANGMGAVSMVLKMKAPKSSDEITENWVVTRSNVAKTEFPSKLLASLSSHRLPTPAVGLAINLSMESSGCDSRLFATLPLPVRTSLPVHIHATWILAQDRRSIRYDAPDAAGQRLDDTLYNERLLKKGVAPLYVQTLALILQHYPEVVRHIWPASEKTKDDIGRVVATELYELIISTEEPVLLSIQDERIAPRDSIIHSSKTPVAVRKIISKLPIKITSPIQKEVSRILQENVVAMRKLWKDNAFTLKEALSVLDYVVDGGESLDGIPLLVLGDNQLVEFQSSGGSWIFANHRTELVGFFGPSTVVNLEVPDLAAANLAKLKVNVGMLDSRGMQDLLELRGLAVTRLVQMATSGTKRDWHNDLLKFLASPDCPVKIQDLADYPLIPAIDQDLVVSLNHARGGKIWWRYPYESRAVTAVLPQLGVIAVDDLPGETRESDISDLTRILRLFGQLGLSSQEVLKRVNPKDWDAFVQHINPWIRDRYLEELSEAELQVLNRLPFFRQSLRQGDNQPSYVPASQVMMLPDSVPLDTLARYLPSETAFAESSAELAAVLRIDGNTQKSLSFTSLFSQLRIPRQLAQEEDDSFSSLLPLIATHHTGPYDGQLVPDGHRVLRSPSELLDHRVDLFSIAYEGHQNLFVHPKFHHLIDSLVRLGVRREITSDILLECIRALDREAREGQDVGLRARWLWDYVNTAPQQLREIKFDAIKGLRFIPRHIQRHPSDSSLDAYVGPLPDVVSLDELCATDYEAVAWTQRARFATLPTAHLAAVYPSIGEPSPADVVRHLTFLVNHIAPRRPQSSILLSDIKSVYDWLENNRENVTALLGPLSNRHLWLNIDSESDDWTWRAGSELVFGLTFDVEGWFVARKFLHPYRSLLVDAGAREYLVASPPPPTTPEAMGPHLELIGLAWNELRQNRQLLDICFQVEGQVIPAHRGMLAAMVPHFLTAFSGPFMESIISAGDSELPVYPLPEDEATSAFAVRSVVDYVYTGAFSHPKFSTIKEAASALDELLNLMELSRIWGITKLSHQVVDAILELQLIRFDNCEDILARAQACQMEVLIDICVRTMEQNQWV